MKVKKIHYAKTERSYWIFGIISLVVVAIYFILNNINSKSEYSSEILIFTLIMIFVALCFNGLTIIIDDKSITASFSLKIIRRKMYLEEIDYDSIKEIKIPWYYGIGIRVTPYGILYNVKPGKAIRIKSLKKKKTLLLGTENFNEIKDVLMKLKNNSLN